MHMSNYKYALNMLQYKTIFLYVFRKQNTQLQDMYNQFEVIYQFYQ